MNGIEISMTRQRPRRGVGVAATMTRTTRKALDFGRAEPYLENAPLGTDHPLHQRRRDRFQVGTGPGIYQDALVLKPLWLGAFAGTGPKDQQDHGPRPISHQR